MANLTLDDILKEVGKRVVSKSVDNLLKHGKSDTGSLADSVKSVVANNELRFDMLSYGKFLDQGVDGTDVKRGKGKNTAWGDGSIKGFTTKQPPTKDLKDWCKRNLGDENLAFVVARSIKEQGIKATYWFTTAYNIETKDLDKMIDEWIDDTEFFE